LRNEELNSVWFQNEGMIPSDEILIPLCKRFTDIVVFFDNDDAGITASKKVSDYINKSFPGKARNLYLPEHLNLERNISDPADMYYKMGSKHLQQFLKEKL
jgi:DNA primase